MQRAHAAMREHLGADTRVARCSTCSHGRTASRCSQCERCLVGREGHSSLTAAHEAIRRSPVSSTSSSRSFSPISISSLKRELDLQLALPIWEDRESAETHAHYEVCRRCDAERDTRRPSSSPDSRDTESGSPNGVEAAENVDRWSAVP